MVEIVYLPDISVCNNHFFPYGLVSCLSTLYFYWFVTMFLPLSRALAELTSFTRQHCINQLKPGARVPNQYLGIGIKFNTCRIYPFNRLTRNYIPCLGQTRTKLHTLFRTERSKTIPCPAAHSRIGNLRREYPPPS